MVGKTGFVDTQIFLQFKTFDEIDWRSVLGADQVLLIVSPVVLSELDEHKNLSAQARLKNRAGIAIKKLYESNKAGGKVRDGVTIKMQDMEPQISFADYHLEAGVPDDRLLASVLSYKMAHPGEAVVLISDDIGINVKSPRLGIDTVRLDDELRLRSEPDPNEQKIRVLEAQVRRLESAMPKLVLRFSDGRNLLTAQLKAIPDHSADELKQRMAAIRSKYPLRKKLSAEAQANSLQSLAAVVMGVTDKDIEDFNSEMKEFYDEYEKWLEHSWLVEQVEGLKVPIDIEIANSGSAPAKDIDVYLHFPNGFMLCNEKKMPSLYDEPSPPEIQSALERLTHGLSIAGPREFSLAARDFELPGNVSNPVIRKSNSYDVQLSIRKLKHNNVERIPTLFAVFSAQDEAKGFSIAYRINAANCPDQIEGELNVRVMRP